jgi:phosphatidylglycerol:prolipoprotein diacylglycerol transferase
MHPILFEIGSFQLRTYGALMAVSFLLALLLARSLNAREGRGDEDLLDLAVWIMLGAVAGARVLYVVVQWPEFWGPDAPPDLGARLLNMVAVWRGGLVFYGGFIGAFAASLVFLKSRRLPVWSYGDVLAPALALGQVTGRLGCWFNGCCYGRVSASCGVVFPAVGDNLPHLPTMLYESAFCLVLAGFLTWFWRRKRYAGQVFWLYALLYALWRFGIEFIRGDSERGVLFSAALSPSQWISLAAGAAALIMLVVLKYRSIVPAETAKDRAPHAHS